FDWLHRHDTQPPQLDQLRLGRWWTSGAQTETDRRGQVLLDRLTRQAGRAGDGTLALLDLPATNHFFDLHPMQLPIAHPVHLLRGGRDGGEWSLQWTNASWRSAGLKLGGDQPPNWPFPRGDLHCAWRSEPRHEYSRRLRVANQPDKLKALFWYPWLSQRVAGCRDARCCCWAVRETS